VPAFVRWPRKFKAGSVLNGIVSAQDWLPTLLAVGGEPDVKEKLLNGHTAGDKYLSGEAQESPREVFFYIGDDGDILAIRMRDWKVVLMEQRAKTLQCWLALRAPARPQDLPLASRPVRASRRELEYLL